MKIFDRITVLRALFPDRRTAAKVARRWQAARLRDPELVQDVIRLAGLLVQQPMTFRDGVAQDVQLDPLRLAYEAGRRDLGLQLQALMGLTTFELNSLMEDFDHDDH